MTKTISSILVLGLTAVFAFSILFTTNLLTAPILETRENQQYLDLLNMDTLGDYEVGEAIVPTGDLFVSGITEIKPFFQNNDLVAVVYTGEASGYSRTTGLSFRLGIRNGIMTQFVVDAHGESAGYGADVLVNVPDALENIGIEAESLWTANLLSISTGSSMTRRGIVNVLKAILVDYVERMSA
jgi:hypothetical protein